MATARKIQLDIKHRPAFAVQNLTQASAEKVNSLLQKNHDEYHIFFNDSGFHNHIVHHLLTLFALGAEPTDIQLAFDYNKDYQRPLTKFSEPKVQEMLKDRAAFSRHLGVNEHYSDFFEFFKREMESKGWQAVLHEYLWSGTAVADDMFVRLFAGFLHPIIHLGYGLEFEQPAIIAEALAQAAAHDASIGKFLLEAKKSSKELGDPKKSIDEIRQSIVRDEKLIKSRTSEKMIAAAAQYSVSSVEDLPLKVAEMFNHAAYFCSAAQRPPHEPKIDFFYMHGINCAISFPKIMAADYIPDQAKIRLLEWKVRADLDLYRSQGMAELRLEEVTNFEDENQRGHSWPEWIKRITQLRDDDGHAAKLIRATAATKQFLNPGDAAHGKALQDGFVMDEKALDKMAEMVIYTVNQPQPWWVRGTGNAEAWKDVPIRKSKKEQSGTALGKL